jgi:peptidoglycan/LPS O-acetylase OafA/YrhL
MPAHRYRALDTLRFFFAVLVVAGHVAGWNNTVPKGGMSVDFFFCLSGFVLTHSIVTSSPSFRVFTVNRIARLVPLHWLTLVICVLVFAHLKWWGEIDSKDLIRNVLLVNGVVPTVHQFNWPSWSISVEVYANVLFFYFIASRRLVVPAGFVLATCFLVLAGLGPQILRADMNVLRCVLGLTAGYLAYEAHLPLHISGSYQCRMISLASTLSLVVLGGLLFTQPSLWSTLVVIAAMPAIIVLIAIEKNALAQTLSTSALAYAGDLSFSIYLIHAPLLLLFRKHHWLGLENDTIFSGTAMQVAAFAILLLLLSVLSFEFFEKPAKRYVREKLFASHRSIDANA